jgi:hypothetical protein
MNLSKTFSGMSGAKVSKRGTFLTEGRYTLKVRQTLVIQPQDGAEAFVLEAEVLTSSNPDLHPVGSERTWFQSFKYRESAFGELKKFTYAILGLDMSKPEDKKTIESKVDPDIEALLAKAVEGNKFFDKVVNCEVVDRPTVNKKTGAEGTFSNYNFTPIATGAVSS